MFKHANRGALPAMLVLGVLIGASLAVASPSRPSGAVSSASPSVVAGPGASGDDDGAREPPQAPRLANALVNGPGGGGKLGGESAHPSAAEWGGSGGSGSTGGGKDNNGKAKGHHDGKGKNG